MANPIDNPRKSNCWECGQVIPNKVKIIYLKFSGFGTGQTFKICPVCIKKISREITKDDVEKTKAFREEASS